MTEPQLDEAQARIIAGYVLDPLSGVDPEDPLGEESQLLVVLGLQQFDGMTPPHPATWLGAITLLLPRACGMYARDTRRPWGEIIEELRGYLAEPL